MGNKKTFKNNPGTAGAGGRRPKRQRTQVQHYADDAPGTFTKKKKRRRSDMDSSDSDSEEDESVHQSPTSDTKSNECASLDDVASAVSAVHNKKRKRPTKAANESTTSTISSLKRPTQQSKPHERKLQEMPPPPAPKTTLLSHTLSVAPVLPVATTCPLARDSLAQEYPVVFGRGLGVPKPPPRPEWSLISHHDFYFPEDYYEVKVSCTPASEDEDPRTALAPVLKSGPWPVCRVVTSLCSYMDWMAVGDSAGFILIYATGPSTIKPLTRLDTSASQREHNRQRNLQTEVEQRCRHKPELLEKRSPFWATAKTPNAIECITWTKNLILVLTSQEIEALQLSSTSTSWDSSRSPSKSKGGSQHCKILWTLPIATTMGGPRKNGSNSLLTGGELVGSYLELHRKGTMVLWNTWGVAVAKNGTKKTEGEEAVVQAENNETSFLEEDLPLLLLRDPGKELTNIGAPEFIQIVPFQRQEEEEKPPPIPVKRSPGRPPKKKPKPKIPVTKSELMWTHHSKCHAALWDRHLQKGDRLVVAFCSAPTTTTTEAQLQLALLKLTDDIGEENVSDGSRGVKAQYAKLLQQTVIPLTGSARISTVPEVTLQQSSKGTYTLVAGSRGVRMYQTETMALLRVYGENVSLHGKTMVWKSCFVLDNKVQQQLYQQQQQQLEAVDDSHEKALEGAEAKRNDDDDGATILRQNRQGFVWIEQENPLAILTDARDAGRPISGKFSTRRRNSLQRVRASSNVDDQEDSDDEDDESHWLHQAWIVGIPHPIRGPKELQETLYFWQGVEKLPLFTLPLPPQCGGVQSILPLVSSFGGKRDGGMWLRLALATVNGECMELAPSIRSDFAGRMYNPGYLVVDDNVEYIEGEDELDKVMVEVGEKREEPDEENLVMGPPIGTKIGGDIVDEQLQEAIRLSLLESKGKVSCDNGDGSDDEEDDDSASSIVVVQDVFGDDDHDLVIPCEPEPFLRQKVLPDFESETLLTVGETTDGDITAKDAEFASEVLSILPQAAVSQQNWEKQKDVAPPKFTLTNEARVSHIEAEPTNGTNDVAGGPLAGKQAKSKRSRAGNLEMMMKASIIPELRQYMTDRAMWWSDGSGAALLEDAWDHALPAKPNFRESPSSSLPLAALDVEKAAAEVIKRSRESKDREAISTSTESSSSGNANDAGTLSLPIPEAKRETETEVAMELLHLSPQPSIVNTSVGVPPDLNLKPRHDAATMDTAAEYGENSLQSVGPLPGQPPALENGGANEVDSGGIQVAVIELKDYSGSTEQYSCTGTVDIPLTLEDCGIRIGEDEGEYSKEVEAAESKETDKDGDSQNGIGEPMEGIELISTQKLMNAEARDGNDEKSKDPEKIVCGVEASKEAMPVVSRVFRCAACQGRMVVHTCGRRALPIDFEAIAKAEKERKEREEEEKKRLKIEKRKQADAKRREAKRLKKEREKREKLEKEAELRRMREAKVAEARASMANIGDCLEPRESPQLNGMLENPEDNHMVETITLPKVAAQGGHADPVHFAIADAWNEHAEKFTAKTTLTEEPPAPVPAPPAPAIVQVTAPVTAPAPVATVVDTEPTVALTPEPSTLDALASMAEAATPHPPQLEHIIHGQHQNDAEVVESAPESTNGSMTPTSGVFTGHISQQRAEHGFSRPPATAEPSAAMIARRNQVLNSYHAIEAGGMAGNRLRVPLADLSTQGHATLNGAMAHSFQISPMANSNRAGGPGQQNVTVFQRRTAGSAISSAGGPTNQPYFGYTQLSSHFRPRVNLGTSSSSAIFTQRPQPQASSQTLHPRTARDATNRAPTIAPNRDAYFPGSQTQPSAAVVVHPNPAPVVPSVSNPLGWIPSQALAQARVAIGAVTNQPQLGQARAPDQVMDTAVAQYHLEHRGVQPGSSPAPGTR